ncbi:GPP34 family phosphoprotein [Streptomyces sp. NBC_01190]|nr:GPP34 family phosphoprotein [Streptomyces sp. NBC_01190]
MVAMDMPSSRPVEPGDLSLALAGAELIEFLRARAVELKHDRVVPSDTVDLADVTLPDDRLLTEGLAAVVREVPYEPVGEWLWRRGRGLAVAYLAAFEAEGQLSRQRDRRWGIFWTSRKVLVDTPARRRADRRWAADEPILAALAAAAGIYDKRTADSPEVTDQAAAAVISAVTDAVAELAEERQRRASKLNDAAVTNYRRGY